LANGGGFTAFLLGIAGYKEFRSFIFWDRLKRGGGAAGGAATGAGGGVAKLIYCTTEPNQSTF